MSCHRLALLLCVAARFANSQAVHPTEGVVLDPSGGAVPSARVSVVTSQGTVVDTSVSDHAGHFSIRALPSGSYAVEAIAPGFQKTQSRVSFPRTAAEPVSIQLGMATSASEITVTGARGTVEDIEESLEFVTSRSREQFSQLPLATIATVLEGAPGVSIQQTTPGAASPILHGMTGYQTLLLMDGVRFNTSIYRSGPNQYVAFVDPAEAERVEVTLGPSAATFGSDSMGGTINVLSRPARFASGRREIHSEFNALGASADASGQSSARVEFAGTRYSLALGGSAAKHNDLRVGGANDSRNIYRRYFGMTHDQIVKVNGDRLQDTGFFQYGVEALGSVRLTASQNLSLRFTRSDLQNVRSYRDLFGGGNKINSSFGPQGMNFGYARWEKLKVGFLDSLSSTFSFNQQNDGSNTWGTLLTDTRQTDNAQVNSKGYTVQATTHVRGRQAVLFGGELYDERIYSTRFFLDPVSGVISQDRALYPNNSRYMTSGIFLQDAITINSRLRATAGVRFSAVRFQTFAADNVTASGRSLGVVDSTRWFSDVTFNSGLQWRIFSGLFFDGNVSRGFRAPNVNDLGAVGAKTLGYDVTAEQAIAVNALLSADSTDTSVSTGKKISSLGPETLMNYEAGFRVQTSKFYFRTHVFDAELANPITGRTLLFPIAQVPATIGGIAVTPLTQSAAQKAAGVTAVITNLTPRAVHTSVNDGGTRFFGIDNSLRWNLTSRWTAEGSYSFLGGLDLNPIRATRRLPPQEGGAKLRYSPGGRRPWMELAFRAAGAQRRFNPGDTDDDRIGASRRRSDIQTIFRSYTVSRYISAGSDGRLGTADDIFTPTGETLRQIQDRVLPLNTILNGVLISADSIRVPLYLSNAGWATLSFHGGYTLRENVLLTFGVNNMFDHNYRSIGSGIDAPGINVYGGVRYSF